MAPAMKTNRIFIDNVVNMCWFVCTHQANMKLKLFNNIVNKMLPIQ